MDSMGIERFIPNPMIIAEIMDIDKALSCILLKQLNMWFEVFFFLLAKFLIFHLIVQVFDI
jgi:hypothetical protein